MKYACSMSYLALSATATESAPTQSGPPWKMVALVIVGLFAVLLAWAVYARLPPAIHRWRDSQLRLFASLCRAHKMSWTKRRLLRRIARWCDLPQEAALFLHPEMLSAALRDPFWEQDHVRIQQLAREMFAKRTT